MKYFFDKTLQHHESGFHSLLQGSEIACKTDATSHPLSAMTSIYALKLQTYVQVELNRSAEMLKS